jgi:hypothetical protein
MTTAMARRGLVPLFIAAVCLVLPGDTKGPAPRTGVSLGARELRRGPLGDELRLRLASTPFPHPLRNGGYAYGEVLYPADTHYSSSSVAVFIPRGFRARGPVNLVFFFHGWFTTIEDAAEQFQLYRQFAQSGARALLVMVEAARNAPDSFGGRLEEPGGFSRLVTELLRALAQEGIVPTANPGGLVLAGHSGAYRVIAEILSHGGLEAKIKEVYLFDALYDRTETFARWIKGGGGRFVSVSAADGEETTDVAELVAALRAEGIPLRIATDTSEGAAADPFARAAPVLFTFSDGDHYAVVGGHDEFRRLLRSSPLLAP